MKHLKPKITRRTNASGTVSFCTDAGVIDGKRQRRFFPSKKAAEEHANQVQQARTKQGAMAFSLNKHQQFDAIGAYEKLKEKEASVTLIEAVDFYLRHNKPKNGKMILSDVITGFLQTIINARKKPRYLKALECAYRKFAESFGSRNIHEITRFEIEQWLNTRTLPKQLSPITKRNYLRDLGMLFKFAVDEGYCAENAVKRIRKPSLIDKAPDIFSIGEAMRILSAAQLFSKEYASENVSYLAIGLFAGLRSSEIETLDWSEVNLHTRRIEVKAEKAKTSRRRFVNISDNLFAWLKPYEKMEGRIVSAGWRDRIEKLAKLAELEKWPKNGLRHSFGSYHYAHHEDPTKTAMEMGHETTKMLFAHYRELVPSDEAAKFWKILPPENGWLMRMPKSEKTNNSDRKLAKKITQLLKEDRNQN